MRKDKTYKTIKSLRDDCLRELQFQTDEDVRVIIQAKIVAFSQALEALGYEQSWLEGDNDGPEEK